MPTEIEEQIQQLTPTERDVLKQLKPGVWTLVGEAGSTEIASIAQNVASGLGKVVIGVALSTILEQIVKSVEARMSDSSKPSQTSSEPIVTPFVRRIAEMRGIPVESVTDEVLEEVAEESRKAARAEAERLGLKSASLRRPKVSKAPTGPLSN